MKGSKEPSNELKHGEERKEKIFVKNHGDHRKWEKDYLEGNSIGSESRDVLKEWEWK